MGTQRRIEVKSSHGCHARPHCPGSLEVTCGPDTKKGDDCPSPSAVLCFLPPTSGTQNLPKTPKLEHSTPSPHRVSRPPSHL
ncbi:R3H Domain-Containing Protein 1 [Manis pentadactyla]|nr:R3H Domain-Containing Protein 1 [Manis pentadactyla]